MSSSFYDVIYLGRFSDADWDENSYATEENSVYEQSFGSAGDPLKDHVQTAEFMDANNSGTLETDNTGYLNEDIRYSVDGATETHALDSIITATVDVTYMNGTTTTYTNVVLFQTTSGDLFLANSSWAGDDLQSGTSRIQSIDVASVDQSDYTGLFQHNLQSFVCFTAGTQIETDTGPRPVETLCAGDRVLTLDHGFQDILWLGTRRVAVQGRARPVRIFKGAMGHGMPRTDIVVSGQHRCLIRSRIANRVHGQQDVFVAAKHLVDTGCAEYVDVSEVTYFHILCAHHQIVFAHECPVETLFTGNQTREVLSARQVLELCALTPPTPWAHMQLSRHASTGSKRRSLLRRHIKNSQPFLPDGLMAAARRNCQQVQHAG